MNCGNASSVKGKQMCEVIFVPDEDIINVIDCFESVKIEHEENLLRKKRNTLKDTPKKNYTTPVKGNNTPVKSIITKSGRKVTSKYKNLNVSFLIEKTIEGTKGEAVDESSDFEPLEESTKPSALYDDDNELGKQLFGFQTPKKRDRMLHKASESIGTNKNQHTPNSKERNIIPKTPYAARTKIKKRIVEEASQQKLDKMLEESESDYIPTSESSESEDSVSETETTDITDQTKYHVQTGVSTRRARGEINHSFMFTSDDYFEYQNTRSITSNHTLSKLKTPKFQQDQLTALLKSINPTHQKAIIDLEQNNQYMYKRWLFSMSEGFNILVYGVGSKKKLLNNFRSEFLQDSLSVVVNGFFPGLTMKEVLDCIAGNVLGIKNVPLQPQEIVETIAIKQKSSYINRVFVIIHNLDGEMLRCEKTQGILAQLASLPKIHLVASVDHINCPLLWDQSKLSKFNFVSEDATTFLPYTEETSYESSMMVQRTGVLALSALKNVYQSLTRNTREVFKKLLEHQLNFTGKYQGMHFSELYRTCRDSFIVSSDLALRSQLTEFIDHHIVRWKKDTDHLLIPIDSGLLKQFQVEITEEE